MCLLSHRRNMLAEYGGNVVINGCREHARQGAISVYVLCAVCKTTPKSFLIRWQKKMAGHMMHLFLDL